MSTPMTPAPPANADPRPVEPDGHALFDACSAGDACIRPCSRQLRTDVNIIHLPPARHILARRDAFLAAILITGLAIALSWLAAQATWPAVIAAEVMQ
ncbi:hypothetical protein M2360_000899 [Rhizobium sp. SG_E_25_P2]|uniref:hypothetical protein n=1 Tax=Rhizobium sp. SG_E_25_P2 TaxID=2879942 RepID=UPI002473B408|nr:hypothetical protein [Rhizobium sp. SG_E_25_P2]MDH6265509.1 hypothetical protein [Rhizobium sp. SG_E_25_P2]